jgi:hypothetical protein
MSRPSYHRLARRTLAGTCWDAAIPMNPVEILVAMLPVKLAMRWGCALIVFAVLWWICRSL